jgi:IclR family transcriptional regulator, acetate operon repressor
VADVRPVNAATNRYEIAVVGRALDLLAELAQGQAITTAGAASVTGTSTATAYRLLLTLQSRGFVQRDREKRNWTLGSAFFAMTDTSTRFRLHAVALPYLTRLRDAVAETVNLAVYANGEVVYIEVLESPLRFRMSGERGERAPLHATALGRAVLAALPPDEQRALLVGLELQPLTDRTIKTSEDLAREIQITAARGWSEEHGEMEVGVTCFGAPIVGNSGRPLGAVSVSAPDARLDAERERVLGAATRDVAAQISDALDD